MPLNRDGLARALWFPSALQTEFREESVPTVGPGDVRVRTLASGISQGTEMLVFRGQAPTNLDLDLPTLAGSFSFPIKYGYASVGRVEEVGADVADLEAGDHVFVHHPHQTEYVAPAAMALRLPSTLTPHRATLLAHLETAVNVVLDTHPRLGDRVVISGQGALGLIITGLIRRAGAGFIIAVDPESSRRRLSQTMGADATVASGEDAHALLQESDVQGADVAIEVSGNPAALEGALDCLGFQGTCVVVSWYGQKTVTLNLGGRFHRRRLRIVSSQVGHLDPAIEPRWSRRRRLELARDLVQELNLESLITHRIPFEEAERAYELLDKSRADVVHVVLTYGGQGV